MVVDPNRYRLIHYTGFARFLHWLTVALVLFMIPSGLLMVYRGKDLGIWDGLTNTLYSAHKLAGFLLLVIILVRLVYRFGNGVPADEPTVNLFHRVTSHATHWAFYILLIAAAVFGWIGASLFPALSIFDIIELPALLAPDRGLAKQAFAIHKLLVMMLAALIAMHIAAALYHHYVRKDNVLRRMLPGLKRRD